MAILDAEPSNRNYRMVDKIEKFLLKFQFFKDFKETDTRNGLSKIAKSLKKLVLQPGDVLFKKGDTPNYFYVIIKGGVEIFQTKDEEALQSQIEEYSSKKMK